MAMDAETKAKVYELILQGMSYREIGKEVPNVTHNAISEIGRAHV